MEEKFYKCPNCGSADTYADSPGVWRLFFSLLLLPISIFFLLGNHNRYCGKCGVRFKTVEQENA
jgi:ribosomal protein S27AE